MLVKKVVIICDKKKWIHEAIKDIDKIDSIELFDHYEIEIVDQPEAFFAREKTMDICENIKNADLYLILAENEWFGNYRTQFFGFELVKILRINRILQPFFILSKASLKQLFDHDVLYSKILKTPGHYFIQYIDNNLVFESKKRKIRKLSLELLDDINTYIFTQKGILHETLHSMKNSIATLINIQKGKERGLFAESKFNVFFKSIESVISTEDRIKWNKIKYTFINNIERSTDSFHAFDQFKIDLLNLCEKIENEKSFISENKYEWQVLFVEDDQATREYVTNKFKLFKINILCAESSREAIEILKKDYKGKLKNGGGNYYPANSITVLIADIRLMDENEYWDDLQGYELISQIKDLHDNLCACFILTNKLHSLKQSAFRARRGEEFWFLKEVLYDDSLFESFIQKIKDEGNAKLDELYSQPHGGHWHKSYPPKFSLPLKYYYRVYRNNIQYSKWEDEVNNISLSYIIDACRQKKEMGYAKMYKIDLGKGLGFNPEKRETLERFKYKLIARRIIIGLWLSDYLYKEKPSREILNAQIPFELTDWNIDEITYLLQREVLPESLYDELGDHYQKKMDQAIKSIINTHLNFSKNLDTEIPHNLLVEEKNWLESLTENVPLYNMLFKNMRSVFFHAQVLISSEIDWINKNAIKFKKYDKQKYEKLLQQYTSLLEMEIVRIKDKIEYDTMRKRMLKLLKEYFPDRSVYFTQKANELTELFESF